MPASLPVIPGARVMSTPFSSCCPSPRVTRRSTGLKAPALAPRGLATKPGAKGRAASAFAQPPPAGDEVRTIGAEGEAAGLPDQGVKPEPALVAQTGGLESAALGPP